MIRSCPKKAIGTGKTLRSGDRSIAASSPSASSRPLTRAASTSDDVVKTTVYLQDMKDFPRVNEVYGRALGAARPARSTVAVAGLPRNVDVEIEAIAALRA